MTDPKSVVETMPKVIKNNEVMAMSKDVIQSKANGNQIQFNAQPVKTPPNVNTIPHFLNKDELTLLRNSTENNAIVRVIVETLLSTGIRIGELLNIKHEDINWEEQQIRIRSISNKPRTVYFSQECSNRLKSYLLSREILSDYLFSGPNGKELSESSLKYLLQRHSEKLGFKITPSILRHTFVMKLIDKGISIEDISLLLGNSNLNTSAMLYRKLKMSESS